MNANEFREFIKDKKYKIDEYINLYKNAEDNFDSRELLEIIKDEFSIEEKKEILLNSKSLYLQLDFKDKKEILISIKSSTDIVEILKNDKYEFKSSFNKFDICDIMKNFSNEDIIRYLEDEELKNIYNIDYGVVYEILSYLDESSLKKLYDDEERLVTIVGYYNIGDFIENSVLMIQDEDKRFQIADQYELDTNKVAYITTKCSDSKKEEVLLSKKYSFSKRDTISILIELNVDNLAQFIKNNATFLDENNLSDIDIIKEYSFDNQIKYLAKYRNELNFHDIIKISSFDKQVEFMRKIDTLNLPIDEKRKSLVVLDSQVKRQTDIINNLELREEYIEALRIPVDDLGFIDYDLDGDLTKYKGLDELINIRPQSMSLETFRKLLKLVKVCPNLNVYDNQDRLSYGYEFVEGEKWISDVINGINPEWDSVQKIAYIDNRIGKRITYSPDFDTEVFNEESSKALWRVISSGYGVCEGIALIEIFILNRIGIESEIVISDGEIENGFDEGKMAKLNRHAFVMVKNIQIQKKDGTYVVGDSLIDPTANLISHRYGYIPIFFLKDYYQMRKIDEDMSTDICLHKTDRLSDNHDLIGIEDETLVKIFSSIGITQENIYSLMRETGAIGCEEVPLEIKIENLLNYFKKRFPDFDKTQNGTIAILSDIVFKHPFMNFKKLVIDRVYNRNDNKKRPLVYLWFNLDGEKELFYIAENGNFTKMNREDFINNYECYENDLYKNNSVKPWDKDKKEIKNDRLVLTRSVN